MIDCNEFWIWVSEINFGNALANSGNFLAGIGTIVLAWAAYKALPKAAHEYKEAKQIDLTVQHEREENERFLYKFNLAKEAIRIFNHLKNDIQQIRSPFGFEGEINKLEALPEENEMIKKMKKRQSAGLVFLRMNERGESLAEMNRLEPEFRAIFGDTEAFDKMRSARHQVWVAATMILEGDSNSDNKKAIYSFGSDDKIKDIIVEAVREIEEICQPVLRGKN